MKHPLVKIILTVFFCCNLFSPKAQAPVIKFKKYYGNSDQIPLIIYDAKPTRSRGLILAGSDSTRMNSGSGFFTGEYKSLGNRPFLLKTDSVGKELWRRNLALADSFYNSAFTSVVETNDGGYIATGKYWDNANAYQMVIARFTFDGNLLWQKKYGGSGDDEGYQIIEDSKGGFVVVGWSASSNGDVTLNKGGNDVWVLKIDETGNIVWSKLYGGTENDQGYSLVQSSDFGFIIAGKTASTNGDLAGVNNSIHSAWLFKIDNTGNYIWKNVYTGQIGVPSFHSVKIANDNSIVLTGLDFVLNPGSQFNYNLELLVAKASMQNGSILWTKTFGGLESDYGYSIQPMIDNSILVSGTTTSRDGDLTKHNLSAIVPWLLHLSANGDLLWDVVTPNPESTWGYQSWLLNNGEYIVTGNDVTYNRGVVFWLGSMNSIKGQLYLDANANNTKDAGETGFNNGLVVVKKQDVEITSASPYNGAFEMPVDTGAYVTTLQLFNPYYTVVPSSRNSTFSSYLNTDSFSFAIQPIANKQDLITHLIPVSPARPGFKAQYVLNYKNIGTTTIANGTVKLIKDNRSAYSFSLPLPASIVADTITWNYTNLKPLDSIAIGIELQLTAPPMLNNNDTLKYTAVVLPVTGDLTPSNDTSSLRQLVQGSYDPNDKQESFAGRMPLRTIQNGAYINYMIRFQNTGNDTAFTVRLMDTLENKLDWSSFEMIGSSHKYSLTIKEGNKLQWVFNDIKLPDSTTNLIRSVGFVAFRIKPKNTVSTNDVIKNKASIYFDYNLPIVTNSADITITNEIITAVREIQNDEMKLQFGPNPSNGFSNLLITGKLMGKFELRVIDNNGSVISQQTITRNSIAETNTIPVHLEKLSSGVYYILLQQKGKSWWQKIILQ
ncbi:DUF7619 domain-containing protein [Lacibacter sp. H407]|uniref:DUF7619 domain-containing protein n=1 Tax=Lacibacter sp. H407 TaxID=3133423 RepID=UPI0030BCB40E